ncbi:MAG TPA: fatty acid--CoA ligase family protein [Thermoanaerobaculaceae bacterium]|nr:fatty acid--CoA ligase family protein [Thermoanaerobaculaceae bacterium]
MPEAGCPIVRRFLALARAAGDAPALLGPDGEVVATRAALAVEIEALRSAFADVVAPGSTVLLSLPNGPELVRWFAALRQLAARVALVDAAAPADEIERSAVAAGAVWVVAPPERLAGCEIVAATGGAAVAVRPGAATIALPERAAVLKLTSGSTGAPRVVAVGARQLAADTVQIMRTMEFGGGDVTMAAIPLTHSYGIGNCLVPLLIAGTPLAFPTCALPAAIAHTLAAARVSHFPAVPAMIRTLATLEDLPALPALRVCLAAGAPLAPVDAAAFHRATGRKVHVFYGCSECGGITYDRSPEPVHAEGAVGAAMARVRVEIVGADLRPVPLGAEGRVLVLSRAVALAELPPSEDGGVLGPGRFLSGDLGVVDARGRVTLTGRVGESLNVAGKKVHPEEVRRVLEEIPGVRRAVVTGLPDPHRGQLVAAVVEVERAATLTVHAVLSGCRARLAPHKVPRRVVIVDELPVSERGKVRKEVVMQLLAGGGQAENAR